MTMYDYSYENTMMLNISILPGQNPKVIPINCRNYDRYILQNVTGQAFLSWYNINEPDNIITIDADLIAVPPITTTLGTFYFNETLGSGSFYQPPTTFAESTFGQLYPPGGLPGSVDYYSFGNLAGNFIFNGPIAAHNRLAILDSLTVIQNEPLILDFRGTGTFWQTAACTNQNATFTGQPLSGFIFNEDGSQYWSNFSRYLPAPFKNISYKNTLRQTPTTTNPNGALIDVASYKPESWALYSGLSSRNLSTMTGIPDFSGVPSYSGIPPILGSYFYYTNIFTLPTDYDTINVQFQNRNDIIPMYSRAYFYDASGNFLYQCEALFNVPFNQYFFSYSGYVGEGIITQCIIQFYTDHNLLVEPQYQNRITTAFYSKSEPAEIVKIFPGWYAGSDDLELIYNLVEEKFAAEGVTVNITYNQNNGLVNITSTDVNTKIINLPTPLNRIFGVYNDNFIEFTTTWTSPNIADLFNNNQFSSANISLPMLAQSGYINESTNILTFIPSNNFGNLLTAANINLYKNFPHGSNLNNLILYVLDGTGVLLNFKEPIQIQFQIFCYNRIANKNVFNETGGSLMRAMGRH